MPLGEVVVDGQPLEIARLPSGGPNQPGGWAWAPHSQAILPGQQDPDEAAVSRAPPENRRTLAWLDWSGGMGAAKVEPRSYSQSHRNNRLHYSDGPTGRMPWRLVRGHEIRVVTPANATGSVTDWFEINSRLYAVIGDTARRITLTLNAETVAARATAGVGNGDATGVYISGAVFTVASPLWYNGTGTRAYLGGTASTQYIVSFDGTATWVQDLDVAIAYWAKSMATDGQRLWGGSPSGDSNGVYVWNLGSANNPFTTDSWSSKYTLNNRQDLITGMAALRDSIIVTTGDGMIWAFDYATGLPTPLTNADGLVPDTTSGLNMGVWNGQLVVPTPRGLLLYVEEANAPGYFEAIGPESLHGHEMPIRGQASALYCGDPAYLWAAFYNGTDSYVLAGRRPYQGEPAASRIIWDTFGVGKVASAKVTSLHISNLGTNPVLCIGTGVPDCQFVTLPRYQMNELQDGNCRSRLTVHSTFLPDHDGGAPTTAKPFRRMRFKTVGFSDAEYANVSVRVDRGNFAQVGTIKDTPAAVINLPAGAEGTALGVQLDWYGTTALATYPQIEAVEVDVTESPLTSKWIDVSVYAAANQQTASGQSTADPLEIIAFLQRLADQVRYIDVTGPDDVVISAKVDPFYGVHSEYVEQLPEHPPGYVVKFRLNVYTELLQHTGARYDVDFYVGGTKVSYYA